MYLKSDHEIFKHRVIINVTDKLIEFKRPSIFYTGKLYKPTKAVGENRYCFNHRIENIPTGKYTVSYIDEDSLVFKFK